MKSEFEQILELIAGKLADSGIACVMVGGHAVNYYGVVRATQDIDFMIAGNDITPVRDIMRKSGYTNIAEHDTVVFFNKPGSPLRVDFLKVDKNTMNKLLENAVVAQYGGAHSLLVPQIRDLLAMKLFALASGPLRRKDKDFSDVVQLVIENRLDTLKELKPVCDQYGNSSLYEALCKRIEELRNA